MTSGYLDVVSFDTEANYDVVELNGKSYSGTAGPSGVYMEEGDIFTWHTDSSGTTVGWKFTLSASSPDDDPPDDREGFCSLKSSTCDSSPSYTSSCSYLCGRSYRVVGTDVTPADRPSASSGCQCYDGTIGEGGEEVVFEDGTVATANKPLYPFPSSETSVSISATVEGVSCVGSYLCELTKNEEKPASFWKSPIAISFAICGPLFCWICYYYGRCICAVCCCRTNVTSSPVSAHRPSSYKPANRTPASQGTSKEESREPLLPIHDFYAGRTPAFKGASKKQESREPLLPIHDFYAGRDSSFGAQREKTPAFQGAAQQEASAPPLPVADYSGGRGSSFGAQRDSEAEVGQSVSVLEELTKIVRLLKESEEKNDPDFVRKAIAVKLNNVYEKLGVPLGERWLGNGRESYGLEGKGKGAGV